ncbi:substrate-binding domain-containing protein [Rubrimonas cliftonensis]|uniref:Tungstate transport system substrate-binding protein n=1 Tax=Rubrimonas cliftonensis TaxID=89524 RepID=A0A1H3X684_9RHOB|nr:substrate-binding domain-containing protein [Rubrimonas cliftonensis]SDZ94909.1 tungstate transport system substrate-binding protein [Rubrimonas cliftonensis]
MTPSHVLAAGLAATLSALPAAAFTVVVGADGPSPAADFLDFASTTFSEVSGGSITVIERSPGAAILAVQNCEADAALLPSEALADGLVAEGDGTARIPVFRTDHVIVGPKADPAGVANASTPARAYEAIAARDAPVFTFAQTQALEMQIWREAAIDPRPGRGDWWREAADPDAAIAAAASAGGYALVERGVFAASPAREGLAILNEGHPMLAVTHQLAPVAPRRCPAADTATAQKLAEWLRSVDGAVAMAAWTIGGEAPVAPVEPAAN